MKYLLDTCMVSYFIQGQINVLNHIKKTPPTELCLSSISSMEIEFGLLLNPARSKKIKPILIKFLSCIHVFPLTEKDAHHAAAIRATLQRKGTMIGAYDVLLAGAALHHGLTLVTSNTREFKRVAGLTIEDWREPG